MTLEHLLFWRGIKKRIAERKRMRWLIEVARRAQERRQEAAKTFDDAMRISARIGVITELVKDFGATPEEAVTAFCELNRLDVEGVKCLVGGEPDEELTKIPRDVLESRDDEF